MANHCCDWKPTKDREPRPPYEQGKKGCGCGMNETQDTLEFGAILLLVEGKRYQEIPGRWANHPPPFRSVAGVKRVQYDGDGDGNGACVSHHLQLASGV